MSDLLSNKYSDYTKKNFISLHVILEYFGVKKLHKITNGSVLAATMYQQSGKANGSSGFVNITDLSGGKVGFSRVNNGGILDATFIKSIKEIPNNISVIQITKAISSVDAEAPAPPPSLLNIPSLMLPHGCKIFAMALLNTPTALITFDNNVNGGLTLFCPNDDSMKRFMPKFNNLTPAGQEAILEYHGVPIYMRKKTLKENNGPVDTLATDGNNKYSFLIQNDGQDVTLKTKIVTAKILSLFIDNKPLSVFVLDRVLIPPELFSSDPIPPTPVPAPAPGSLYHKLAPPPPPAVARDIPGEGPAGDDNSGPDFGLDGGKFVVVTLSVGIVSLLLF